MVNDFAAKNKQRKHGQKREPRAQDRPAQRLVDTLVHDRRKIVAPPDFQIFADTVEHNDRVIHRITDQRQQCRDYRQVDFAVKQRKQTKRHQRVVEDRKHRRRAINPFKPERDINKDASQRVKGGKYRLALQFVTDLRADRRGVQYGELSGVTLIERRENDVAAGTGVFLFCSLELNKDVV